MSKTKNCHCCDGSGKELDHISVGEEMKAFRESRSLSQKLVARRMKISQCYLCDLEQGKRNWNDGLVERFRRACS